MLLDILACGCIVVVSYITGRGLLALFGAHGLRQGDRFLAATWLGIVVLSVALLGVSILVPLSATAGTVVAIAAAAIGSLLARRFAASPIRERVRHDPTRSAAALGTTAIVVGAAALASDRVTLYDSLVYHVGVIRWLHDFGVVPGLALIHNRLGHISAWFALSAPFDSGPLAGRMANVGLVTALAMVAFQGALGAARVASRNGSPTDWFLLLSSVALTWPALRYNAATPSPDVVANILIVIVAWTMLVTPRASGQRSSRRRHLLNPRIVPVVLAAGACAMKLFALPSLVAASLFYAFGPADQARVRSVATRLAVCALTAVVILAPLVAANLVASGCPLFPSSIGCLDLPWALHRADVADYAVYIRNVARWESRRTVIAAEQLPWIGSWVGAHPVVTLLALLAGPLTVALLRGPRRDGVRSVLLACVLGTAFAAWQAPAPRFLYAFVMMVPILAIVFTIAPRAARQPNAAPDAGGGLVRVEGIAFVCFAMLVALGYGLASQKLNALSAMGTGQSPFGQSVSTLVVPDQPEPPARLFRWRVNDFELFTPVPRPVADTLSYHSEIDGDLGFEKCSTAPLPCTPYLPAPTVRLRSPERGIGAGFVRVRHAVASRDAALTCVGQVLAPAMPGRPFELRPATRIADGCEEPENR